MDIDASTTSTAPGHITPPKFCNAHLCPRLDKIRTMMSHLERECTPQDFKHPDTIPHNIIESLKPFEYGGFESDAAHCIHVHRLHMAHIFNKRDTNNILAMRNMAQIIKIQKNHIEKLNGRIICLRDFLSAKEKELLAIKTNLISEHKPIIIEMNAPTELILDLEQLPIKRPAPVYVAKKQPQPHKKRRVNDAQ